jgi:hypothetical protein
MSKYFVCCEECFHTLGKKKAKLVRLWMDLCTMYCAANRSVYLDEQIIPNLRNLENLGFVVSTECNNGLLIKVMGHCVSNEGERCFCIKGGDHG